MLRVTFIFCLVLTSLSSWVWAQCSGVTTQLTPFAKEQLLVSTTPIALTPATYKPPGVTPVMATISIQGGTIHYEVVGTPTVDDGHPITSPATFNICGIDSIAAFKAIRLDTDSLLTVTYYKPK